MNTRFLIAASVAFTVHAATAQTPTDAEVRKIDKEQARITLKHGEIKNLEMPPMTMVFRVREPKQLDGMAVGDKVRFTAEQIDGNYTVTSITKAP
jgi:Cu(I)/Ag(I) efflux system periplasmic protein CusF